MDIIIQDDGIITPFNIQSSRETGFTLMAETREATEEKESADGDIDFGTELKTNTFILHGIIEFSSIEERNSIINTLKAQLNECRSPQRIMYECLPDRYTMIRLVEKPEISFYPNHIEIKVTFEADPFWYSTDEHSFTGSGALTNNGSFETPLVIEVEGLATDPVVKVGSYTLSYSGSLGEGQKLIIDTDKMTVKIGDTNVLGGFSGSFPKIQPGNTNVVAASSGTTTFKWRDRWI